MDGRKIMITVYRVEVWERYSDYYEVYFIETTGGEDHAGFMARNKARNMGFDFPVVEYCDIDRYYFKQI